MSLELAQLSSMCPGNIAWVKSLKPYIVLSAFVCGAEKATSKSVLAPVSSG